MNLKRKKCLVRGALVSSAKFTIMGSLLLSFQVLATSPRSCPEGETEAHEMLKLIVSEIQKRGLSNKQKLELSSSELHQALRNISNATKFGNIDIDGPNQIAMWCSSPEKEGRSDHVIYIIDYKTMAVRSFIMTQE
jgi:hypothetical protein